MKDVKSDKESFESSFITVFADGPKTLAVRKFHSLGFHSKPSNTALGMVYELEWKDNPLMDCEYYYGPEFSVWEFGWIFPKKDLINVGVGALLSALEKKRKNIRSILDYFVHRHPISSTKLRGKKVLSVAAGLIPLAPARKIYGPSTLVVGDAAGMVDPMGGNGIDYCIFAGKIAGQTIVKALEQEDYSEEFLSRYQILWENSKNFARIRKGYLISRMLRPFARVDRNIPAKFKALSYLRGRREIRKSLSSLLYPIRV